MCRGRSVRQRQYLAMQKHQPVSCLKKLNFDIICWNCPVSVETITIYGPPVKRRFKGSLTVLTLKLPRGLGTFSSIGFSCHKEQMIGQNHPLVDMEKVLCLKGQCGFIFTARAYHSQCFKTARGYLGSTVHEISKSDEGWNDRQDTREVRMTVRVSYTV